MTLIKMLKPLLDFLVARPPTELTAWNRWQIQPICGGANSRVYRATDPENDLAIKFMVCDRLLRTGHEFSV